MADETNSAGNSGATPIPENIAPGLDLFAATWLEEFAKIGGSISLFADGSAQIGWPVFDLSPLYGDVDEQNRMAQGWQYHNYLLSDGMFHGRARALSDLLDAVPCGREAVKAHMRAHGLPRYYGTAVAGRSL